MRSIVNPPFTYKRIVVRINKKNMKAFIILLILSLGFAMNNGEENMDKDMTERSELKKVIKEILMEMEKEHMKMMLSQEK